MLPACSHLQQPVCLDAPVYHARLASAPRRVSLVSVLHMLSGARDTALPHQQPGTQHAACQTQTAACASLC